MFILAVYRSYRVKVMFIISSSHVSIKYMPNVVKLELQFLYLIVVTDVLGGRFLLVT